MPQITSGGNATFTVAANNVIDVQCPGGWIQLEYPVGTKVFEGNPAGRTFGPYAAGSAKLTSVKGDIYYEVDPSPSANVPFDPNNVSIGGGVSAALGNTDTGVYNVKPQTLRNVRKALASVLAGAGSGRILCIGDSTTMGSGAVAGLVGPGVKNGAYPTKLASLLTSAGFASSTQGVFGDFGMFNSAPTYDTRISLGSWAFDAAVVKSFGGQSIKASAATASPLAFTPVGNTDTCEIYYATGSSTGSFNANVNGGTNTLIATNTGNGVGKTTITGALGANTYNMSWASGGSVFILGFIAYDSSQKQMVVVNSGQGGANAVDFSSVWQGPAAHIARIAPNLTVLEVGINDWLDATDVTAFTGYVQTTMTAALATGDLLLVSPIAQNPAGTPDATQAAYKSAIASLAASNGVPYLDLNRRWTSFADANAMGMYYSDGIHGSAIGYADEALAIRNLLLQC